MSYDPGDEMEVDLGRREPPGDYSGKLSATNEASAYPVYADRTPNPVPRVVSRGARCGRCFRYKCVRVGFRLVNSLFAALFLASAALQYNDSDGLPWAAIYFGAAVFCILSELSWRRLRTFFVLPTLWIFTLSTTIGAAYILIARLLLRDPEGGASGEEANEFYGLVLVSFWMTVVLLLDRHNVVGVFRGYTSLTEHERDREGHVQMGEVVL